METKAKHTPGSIRAARAIATSPNCMDLLVAFTAINSPMGLSKNSEDEQRAIASLAEIIDRETAAPELLKALERADGEGQHAEGCPWWDIPINDLDGSDESSAQQESACDCFVGAVRNALDKAGGGS